MRYLLKGVCQFASTYTIDPRLLNSENDDRTYRVERSNPHDETEASLGAIIRVVHAGVVIAFDGCDLDLVSVSVFFSLCVFYAFSVGERGQSIYVKKEEQNYL